MHKAPAKFGQLTGENLPNKATGLAHELGIVLDNVLQSAASIRSTITDRGQITGSFDEAYVDFVVNVLNSGSLPAALQKEPISQDEISSQLGEDTIASGRDAMILSTIAVVAFMLFYYRFAGAVADLAVVMNMILAVALMLLIKAAFTLPGLAGLVLTVGMAVDANVLVYERMREEAARGASLRMTIRNGFSRAMATIIDSNLTTVATAVVLFAIGTDQIKGFAVSLILGLVVSMYTAVYVARVVFDVAERQRWLTKLHMRQMIGETHIDFVKWRGPAIALSLVVIAIGMVAVWCVARTCLDIDFTGGTSVQLLFKPEKAMDVAEVRQADCCGTRAGRRVGEFRRPAKAGIQDRYVAARHSVGAIATQGSLRRCTGHVFDGIHRSDGDQAQGRSVRPQINPEIVSAGRREEAASQRQRSQSGA